MSSNLNVVIATDCGSTTTKAILIEKKGRHYRQTYRGEAPTTVEAPFEDVTRGVLNAIQEIEELSVEALGASRGGDGFTPLPYVKMELNSIVGLEGSAGSIVPGRAWLDERFDKVAFSDALESGRPVIHVATHFDLTEDETSSRLLLGTGETLSMAAFKDEVRAGKYDLNDVQMLVLSACSTGFSGGGELESLATEMQYEGVRTVLANAAALPFAALLLFTGIGAAAVFWAVNAFLIGRELRDMVWIRHRSDPAESAPMGGVNRFLLGGVVVALLAVPFINLLAPIIGAAAATHMVHRARQRVPNP